MQNSKFLIYVVDLKIFKEVKSEVIRLFKSDITRLYNWNYLNGLRWNFEKCDIMIYDKWKTKNNNNIKYKIGKHEIKHTSVICNVAISGFAEIVTLL